VPRYSTLYLPTVLLVANVTCAAVLRAQEPGGDAAAFLERTSTAAEAAFGGIAFPLSNEGAAIFRNGSSLTRLRGVSVVVSASMYPDGESQMAAGVGVPIGVDGGISIGISSYSVQDYRGFTADDRPTATFSSSDIALALGGGLSLGPASMGTTVRLLSSTLEGAYPGGAGYALDLSGSFTFEERLYVDAVLTNAAGDMTWSEGASARELLPWRLRMGCVFVVPFEDRWEVVRDDATGIPTRRALTPRSYLALAVEGRLVENGTSTGFGIGAEWAPVAEVPLRIRLGSEIGGDLGFGFAYAVAMEGVRSLRADLSVRLDRDLGRVTQHASLTASF